MIYATLGNIMFELLPVTGLDEKYAYQFAEHQVIEGKPLLQFIGDNLDETNLALRFHVSFCDPAAEFAALKAEGDKHSALVLQFANGTIAGRRVITEIQKTTETTADNGRPISIDVKLTLREWHDPAPIITQQIRQKMSALALQGKGAISSPMLAPGNSVALASGQIVAAGSAMSRQVAKTATLADSIGAVGAQVKQQAAEMSAKIVPMVQAAKDMAKDAKAASDQAKGYATQIAGISSDVTRITSGLPSPFNKMGNQIAVINKSISAKANQVITVAEVNGSRADESATRAGMITRMLPKAQN